MGREKARLVYGLLATLHLLSSSTMKVYRVPAVDSISCVLVFRILPDPLTGLLIY